MNTSNTPSKIIEKRSNPETSRFGLRWTKEEDLQILEELKNNLEITEIAKNHGRSIVSIKCRIYQHCSSLINDGNKTLDDLTKTIKIPLEELKTGILEYEKGLKLKEVAKKIKDELKQALLQDQKPVNEEVKTEVLEDKVSKETKFNNILEGLNDKQKEAVNSIKDGENIFLTGSPGTGKSFTLKRIVKVLKLNNIEYGITALTGCAAILINAQTVHSYLGLGIGKGSVQDILNKLKNRQINKYATLCKLQTLVIDEISMMDDALFDKISELLCAIKRNKLPFGGVQLILVGDFCQLPPVNGDYCFTSSLWELSKLKTVELTELVRQKGDIEFQNILQEIRKGKCSKKTFNKLLELRNTKFENGIIPTKLYPINTNVDHINKKEYDKLCNENKDNKEIFYKSKPAKKDIKTEQYDITLMKNAQIMITRNINIEDGLINGTRGIVVELNEKYIIIRDKHNRVHKIEYYQDVDHNEELLIRFMPVKLAYAMSIHKSQGTTLDAVEIDGGCNIFAPGQLYTALSRAVSLSSIKIIDLHLDSFITSLKVKKFYDL